MAEATASETEVNADQAEDGSTVEVSEAELPEAAQSGPQAGGGQIDILLDATMTISVHLGEAGMTVRELLQLGPGSVVQLARQAGEPVEVCLHGVPFATGNLVVVGEQLGVRIREILSSAPVAAGGAGNDN